MTLNLGCLVEESARIRPDRIALIDGDEQIDYRALDDRIRRFASGLKDLGIDPGQHVALMLPNVSAFPIAYFGGHYAANPVVPLNILLKADEIEYHLKDSDAVALVVHEDYLGEALKGFSRVPTCEHLIIVGETPAQGVSFDDLLSRSQPVADLAPTMPDDTAVILYTSGTTGQPKGAELTHFNMFYNADYIATRLSPHTEESIGLACLPLFHSFGQTVVMNSLLRVGGSVVLVSRFDPLDILGTMERCKITFFAGVPTMYFALLHQEGADRFDLGELEFCNCGGAAMPEEVMKAFDAKYGVNILEGYGLSETSPVASFNVLDREKKVGSIGLPIGGVKFRLTDSDDKVIEETGVPGEIWIKGHNVMKGYYGKPEATAEAVQDGWFRTGDIATVDEDGYYRIVDRAKDMIIRGGFNVYPREVEEVIYGHPSITEAAVLGVPDPKFGEEIKAFVVLKEGESLAGDDIVDYCKERLAAYKYPRSVEIRDALPKGPTGKILKRDLRVE